MAYASWLRIGASGVVLALATAGAPRAQAAGQPTAGSGASSQNSTTIAEVTVTAEKRQERLIDTPVAASALSYAQLQTYATTDLESIGSQLPQVQLVETGGSSAGAALSIRGVGNLAVDYGTEEPVALVIDGMQLTRGHAIDMGAFDIGQVEVLEGPQALFFGKNSPAGVVALSTVSPGRKFEGYVRAGYETTTNNPFGEFAVSLPLSDTLSVRVALRYSNMIGGYVRNVARPIADPFPTETAFTLPGAAASERPANKSVIGRFTVVWRPNADFDATLKFTGSDFKNNGEALGEGVANCAPGNSHPTTVDLLNPAADVQDPFGPCNLNSGTISNGNAPREVTSHFLGGPANGQPFQDDNAYLTTLNMNYHLGKITLTSVTGFYYYNEAGYDNYDLSVFGQALDTQSEVNKTVTQEIRVASSFDSPINFAAGGFYEYDNRYLTNSDKIFPFGPYPGAGPYNGMYNTLALTSANSGTSYSLFGQLKWKLLPTLELDGGVRWSHDSKDTNTANIFNYFDLFTTPATNPFAPAGEYFHPRESEDNVSPEVTLTWHPYEGVITYGAFKEGYLAGGSSNPGNLSNYDILCSKIANCTNPSGLLEYLPETVKGGEIGAKASLLGGSLYGDLTLYRYQYTNLQVTTFDSATLNYFTTNAASSLSEGVEAKLRYNVSHAFQIHGFVGYTDLHYLNFQGAQCYSGQTVAQGCIGLRSQDLTGTSYGGAPWEINLGFNYQRELTQAWGLGLAGDMYCYTRTPRPNNDPFAAGGDAYCQGNAALRLYQEQGPLEFAIIAKNLGDNRYVYPAAVGKPLGAPGDLGSVIAPPREVTLQVTYRF